MTAIATNYIEKIAAAAISYAERDWPPFPLHAVVDGGCACIRAACGDAGKHPLANGWQRSLASPRAAAHIWRRDARVERGIGLALGPRAGIWVLDVDSAHGGEMSLLRLENEHGQLPVTWEVATGGGGRHLYWEWPGDGGEEIRNSAGKIAPGIDVRGAGGFVVAPPSLHASGKRYRWIYRGRPGPVAASPWLVELARAAPRRKATPSSESTGEELVLRAGTRHDGLVRFCGVLRSIGLGEAAIVECGHALLKHHAVDDDPARPIDRAHAERVMRDVARRYRPDGWRT